LLSGKVINYCLK